MSNCAYIDINKIEKVKTGEIRYEIAIFDSYNSGSVDIEKEQTTMTDIETLQYLVDNNPDESDDVYLLISSLVENQKGVSVNGTFYDWDEIKHLFGIE